MQQQIYTPPLTKINKRLLITCAVIFVLTSALNQFQAISLYPILGLSLEGVLKGMIFQLLTYPLVNHGLLSFVFSGLIIWFIGSDLESRWGTKIYVQFLIFSIFGAGCVYLLASALLFDGSNLQSMPLMGLHGFSYSLLVAYAVIFSDRIMNFMLIFPMKAKYFCWLLIGIELYMSFFSPYRNSSWAHLAAMGFGFGFLKWLSLKAQKKSLGSVLKEQYRAKQKKKFYIVKDDDDDSNPKYWH